MGGHFCGGFPCLRYDAPVVAFHFYLIEFIASLASLKSSITGPSPSSLIGSPPATLYSRLSNIRSASELNPITVNHCIPNFVIVPKWVLTAINKALWFSLAIVLWLLYFGFGPIPKPCMNKH